VAALNPLRNEHQRGPGGHLPREEVHERLLADRVDCVDRVACLLGGDPGELVERRALARIHHGTTDLFLQLADRRQEVVDGVHRTFL
jgi:hypothetical protein